MSTTEDRSGDEVGRRASPGWTRSSSRSSSPSRTSTASVAHGEHEQRIGAADPDWPAWYASYMVAEQAGTELPT